MALASHADAEIDDPATIIHHINTPLAMVEHSSRLSIKTVKLKYQTPQGIYPGLGV